MDVATTGGRPRPGRGARPSQRALLRPHLPVPAVERPRQPPRLGPGVAVVPSEPARSLPLVAPEQRAPRYVKVLDQTKCIGCHACTTACKSEHEVPVGVTRTYVKAVDVG